MTIVALSSPPGASLRGVLRLSGPQAWVIAQGLVENPENAPDLPRRVLCRTLRHWPLPCLLLLFAAPASYTGEAIAELHLPGSPALLQEMLSRALQAGARLAEPGEFTARAFFHGKLDLTQAEGIAATIAARSRRELRAAGALRDGLLWQWTRETSEELADLLALIEAGIDFSEEPDVSLISIEDAQRRLMALLHRVGTLIEQTPSWERCQSLPRVLLLGYPNVGKSSLLNSLSGQQRAIVSPEAGTTRDLLRAVMESDQGPVELLDVGGIEPEDQELRAKMGEVRRRALAEADLVVWVESSQMAASEPPELEVPVVRVINQMDRGDRPGAGWRVSALSGQGMGELRQEILRQLRELPGESGVHLNPRHRQALREGQEFLERALELVAALKRSPELLASELRLALEALGQLSGSLGQEAILDRIFGQFCIGK